MYQAEHYWKNYMAHWFGKNFIKQWETHAALIQIDATKGSIQAEVYTNEDKSKPTLVFAHGISGYARLLVPFLIPLFQKGYNIVAPDLEGYGYNKRKKGDFTWNTHLENLRDTVQYARKNFSGKVYVGGASMGGPLAYATDAKYNCADGLICWCLFDFADKEFMRKETNTKQFTYLLIPFLKVFAKVLGNVRLKTEYFISYDTLTNDQAFNNMLRKDPQAGKLISLKGAISLVTESKPTLAHAAYTKPVLVCQPNEDQMTPSYYTQKTFSRLASKKKKLILFEGEHFPTHPAVYLKWADTVDSFLKSIT